MSGLPHWTRFKRMKSETIDRVVLKHERVPFNLPNDEEHPSNCTTSLRGRSPGKEGQGVQSGHSEKFTNLFYYQAKIWSDVAMAFFAFPAKGNEVVSECPTLPQRSNGEDTSSGAGLQINGRATHKDRSEARTPLKNLDA